MSCNNNYRLCYYTWRLFHPIFLSEQLQIRMTMMSRLVSVHTPPCLFIWTGLFSGMQKHSNMSINSNMNNNLLQKHLHLLLGSFSRTFADFQCKNLFRNLKVLSGTLLRHKNFWSLYTAETCLLIRVIREHLHGPRHFLESFGAQTCSGIFKHGRHVLS